jgi:hypothetical protein
MSEETAAFPDADPYVPAVSRMCDYYLGGTDNFAVDRAAAEQVLSVVPQGRHIAQENRRFLVRAVLHMASHGVRQFVDFGTGYPASPSVHETAEALVDDPRVVYVDHDPLVVQRNHALLAAEQDRFTVLRGDIRCPRQIFKQEALWQTIDFRQPVGLLLVAVLHFIPNEDDPESSVALFRSWMAAGSLLAVSHVCSDGTDPGVMAAIRSVYRTANAPAVFRTRPEIARFFSGLDLVEPGLIDVSAWRSNEPRSATGLPLQLLAGVGRKS